MFYHRLFLIVFLLIRLTAIAETDSLSRKHNLVELEFIGKSYLSPYDRGVSYATAYYHRLFNVDQIAIGAGLGVGCFMSWWLEEVDNKYVVHQPIVPTLIVGVSLAKANKRHGVKGGLYIGQAFGKQQYHYSPAPRTQLDVVVNYDRQYVGEVGYYFKSKGQHLQVSVAWTPRYFGKMPDGSEYSSWYLTWGGISIGYTW